MVPVVPKVEQRAGMMGGNWRPHTGGPEAALKAAEPSAAGGARREAGRVLLYPGILHSRLHIPGPPVWSRLPLGPCVPHLLQPG